MALGGFTAFAGFLSIHRASSQKRKKFRSRSRFLDAVIGASDQVPRKCRIASTSRLFRSRIPCLSHHRRRRFSRTFFCFWMVDFASFRASASAKNVSTASATVGVSGLTTPMLPDAPQARMSSDAASHYVRFRERRMYSPRREPCTHIGHALLHPSRPWRYEASCRTSSRGSAVER